MRIGVDVRELSGRPTGVGRYLGELIGAWATAPECGAARHEWVFYAPRAVQGEYAGALDAIAGRVRLLPGRSGTRWEQWSLARAANRDGLDVLFAPAYTSPLALRCPVVLTLHDVSFIAHPEWFRPRERLRRTWVTRRSAARARLVLTESEFSKQEIRRLLAVPDHRLRVVRPGCPTSVAGALAGAGRRDPLVLYVGSLFNRRRLPDLVAAFGRVAGLNPDARLAIVGDNRTWPWQDIRGACESSGLASRVDVHDYVADDVLADLYRRARCFVFLSEYEGFGLTPLEALAHGVPSVLLDTPVARETCGPAALYVSRGDIPGIAAAIGRLLDEDAGATDVLHDAEAVLARYSWPRAARETLAALEEAAG